jgi:sugar-specific transcriptional regulator TrmB
MSQNLYQFLKNIGISQKEVSVYLYLLSVESALPMEIAKETHLKRSTVYLILELLKEKGLVREVERGKRSAYISEDPERIRFLLEKLKLQTESSIKSLNIIIPQLKATLRKEGEPPLIRFFEGERAVQVSMEELVGNPKFRRELNYDAFSLELVYKLFQHKNLRKYIDLRTRQNNYFKLLYTSDEGELSKAEVHGQEAIKIDQKEFPITCDISIFEDEVRFHMLGKPIYGILIKNQELAQTLISIFKLAMKGAKTK